MSEEKTVREEFRISGEQLLKTVRGLVHEGNIRRVIIKQDDRTILEIPLTLGVAGILWHLPWPPWELWQRWSLSVRSSWRRWNRLSR
jgi:hypothetical protein